MRIILLTLFALAACDISPGLDTAMPALVDCTDEAAEVPIDADEDGYTAALDCDDADPTVGAPVGAWYDEDGDGYGDPDRPAAGCGADEAAGYVDNSSDCDDTDPELNPTTLTYPDDDGDGFGDASQPTAACVLAYGYTYDNTDCNDGYASINPDAEEICDGYDQDCDGRADEGAELQTWYPDGDGDGYGNEDDALAVHACDPGDVVGDRYYWSTISGDCDDQDPDAYPGAPETWYGEEMDCDEST